MQLKIGNLMAILPAMFSFWIFFQLRPAIMHTISCMPRVVSGNPLEIRLEGAIGIGLVVLGVVCVARLIRAERTNDHK